MTDKRHIRDEALLRTKALPAAGATAYTDSLDLTGGHAVPENLELFVSAPAVPSLADTKTATYRFEESDDDSTFADAAWSPVLITQTGAGGAGAAAATARIRPPSSAKRYVRLQIDVASAGGDNTAKTASFIPLF